MAKSQSQEQKEYNSLLSLTQSMLGKIGDSMSEIANNSDKRNKKLQEQVSLSKQIVDSIQTEKDLEDALLKLEQQRKQINSQNFGVNEASKNTLLQQNQAMQGVLQKQKTQAQILARVDDIVGETTDKFKGYLDDIDSGLQKIPIIGKALSNTFQPFKEKTEEIIDKVGNEFSSKFQESFLESQAAGDNLATSVTKGIGGGLRGAYRELQALTGPWAPIIVGALAVAGALYLALKRFTEIDKAAQKFRESTGLLNSQTAQVRDNIKFVSRDFAALGVSADDVATAAADFTNEFSGLEQPSREVLGSMVSLNKNFGIGTKEASQLNKVFQNIGGLSAEQSQYLVGQTAEMAKMAGVAPDKVIKDMADNSEYAYRYFQGSPKELAKAAVEAAKLGTSIKEAGKVADNLLDFESSISKELEASAILGTNINLGQSRYLASTGDILGAQQAVVDEVSKLGDITKLNKWQQDALVEATGMEFESLVNQQRIRERFGKLNKEQLASAMALVDAGKDISQVSMDDLNAQTGRLAAQREMQSVLDNMSNNFSSLSTAFFDMFEPVGSFVLPLLGDIVSIVVGVLGPALRGLGTVIGYILSPLKATYDTFKALVTDGPGAMLDKFKEMGPVLSTIVGIVGTLALIWVASILPSVLATVASLAVGFIGALISAIPLIVSMAIGFITSAIAAISTMSALTLGIGAIAIIGGIAAASAAANSAVSEGESQVQGSINDGVVQDGKVISTSPEDYLIATKNPAGLAESVGGGGVNISMDSVIAELRELKQAFLSNKDVYMDSVKVTSVVRKTTERSTDNNFGIQSA